MTRIYLANGLFNLGEILVNEKLAKELRDNIEGIDLYVPQENDAINDKNAYADSVMIAKADYEKLEETDYLVAVIDGIEIDSGVATEIGIAFAQGKKIFALYTDSRQFGTTNFRKIDALVQDATENQFMYRNLFVVGIIKQSGGAIYNNIADLVTAVKKEIEGNV